MANNGAIFKDFSYHVVQKSLVLISKQWPVTKRQN